MIAGRLQWLCNLPAFAPRPAGGLGARVSACADLTIELLSCWVDPHVLGKNTETAIVGYRWSGVEGHHALYC